MGERLLCKQEVVGSIPSGSTSGDPVGQPLNNFRPRTSRTARPKTNPRLAKRPVHGTSAMRVLSDIVKRRSFRANVVAAGRDVLRAPKHMFDFGHHPSAGVAHVCQRSLTASLSVRSCEARIEVFLNQCSIGANESSYRPSAVTYLVAGIRRGSRRRTDDGWALIMRVIKCDKGIWWMPWR